MQLSDFHIRTVIECHLSNKSVRQISFLLELPRSTVSDVIANGRQHKLTERDRRVLKRVASIVCPRLQLPILPLEATASGCNVSRITVSRELMKWFSMAEQPHTSLKSPCTKRWLE
uniref:Transposase n=1 Tax=Oncorhynchus tshawytscha TaxID=74940 RepID=A0AAZ3PBR0_ONCTS